MKENRKLERWELLQYLSVHDREARSLLGVVVNISTEGLLVESERPIACGKHFKLVMEVASKIVMLEARSMWCEAHEDKKVFHTGFRLQNPQRHCVKLIRSLIETLWAKDEKQASAKTAGPA